MPTSRLLVFLLTIPLVAQTYRVEAVAGKDHSLEGPGTSVLLRDPGDLIPGRNGEFFVSDARDNRVRRIAPDFTVTTVAGAGHCCFSGDNGPARAADIGNPDALAFDAARNRLYIGQTAYFRIRMVDLNTGRITTIAGTGRSAYAPASENANALQASMVPKYLATDDAGNLYVSDPVNYRVYRIDAATNTFRTIAGNGATRSVYNSYNDGPSALSIPLDPGWVAAQGNNLVLMDGGNVRLIDLPTGSIRTVVRIWGTSEGRNDAGVGSGPGLALTKPVLAGSEVLVAGAILGRVYRFPLNELLDLANLAVYLFWSPTVAYAVDQPSDLLLAFAISGNTALAIGNDESVSQFVERRLVRVVGQGRPLLNEPAADSFLQNPASLATMSSGAILLADTGNDRVRAIDQAGNLSTFPAFLDYEIRDANLRARFDPSSAIEGPAPGEIYFTTSGVVARTAAGSPASLLVAGAPTGQTGFRGDGGHPFNALLSRASALLRMPDGSLLIADFGNSRIRRVTPDGRIIVTAAGSGTPNFIPGAAPLVTGMSPYDLALGPDGLVYIADPQNHRVYRMDLVKNTIETVAGIGISGFLGDGGPATQALLNQPSGVAVSPQGEIFIADRGNRRIRRVSPSGTISTVAGNGEFAATGDGGPSLAAAMAPHRLAVVGTDVFFTDSDFHRLRKLVQTAPPTPTPVIDAGGVVSLASSQNRAAAGAFISIYGSQLAPETVTSSESPLPTKLGKVSVLMNGRAIPLFYVSPTQINAQIPTNQPPGTAEIRVVREDQPGDAQTSVTQTILIVDAQPDILVYNGSHAVAIHEDGSVNGSGRGVLPGRYLVVFLSGIGMTSPGVATGAPAPASPLAQATGSFSATIGGTPARVAFLGLTPGYAGLAQANIEIPEGVAPGELDLILTLRGVASNTVQVTIR